MRVVHSLLVVTTLIVVTSTSARAEKMKVPCSKEVVEVGSSVIQQAVTLMAQNVYFHRGHINTEAGKKAITAVVFNRMNDCSRPWPRSIRAVITSGKERGKNCDFSWQCDGRSDVPEDMERFEKDLVLAKKWLREYLDGTFEDPTEEATWFLYKENSKPRSWPEGLTATATFGQYTFYSY